MTEYLEDFALGKTEKKTAVINVEPGRNPDVAKLLTEIMSAKEYADKRVITGPQDVKDATNDLSLIQKLRKAVEDKRKEYTDPLNSYLKDINASFKLLSEPLAQANDITRKKILDYNAEIERQRREAERIEAERRQLARDEMELKGEHTQDLEPVEKPPEAPKTVRTDFGTTSTMTIRKWALEDITKVPAEYLMVDAGKITKLVKAGIGHIDGIRIWEEDTLRIRTINT